MTDSSFQQRLEPWLRCSFTRATARVGAKCGRWGNPPWSLWSAWSGVGRERPAVNEPRSLAWAPTAALVCGRDLFEEVSGFDETSTRSPSARISTSAAKLRQTRGRRSCTSLSRRFFHFEARAPNNSSFSDHKQEVFIHHIRFLRQRWATFIPSGPVSAEKESAYLLVHRKNYTDLRNARVTVMKDSLGNFADPMDGRI